MLPRRSEIQAERARRSLRVFAERAWPLVEPGTPFVPGFHIDAICTELEAVTAGKQRRLLINVPPRHGKSLLVSVIWPAWVWATRPQTRWLFASYAQPLATRDSVRCRRLLESPWYRDNFGRRFLLAGDQNAKGRFDNSCGGVRLATSVGGSATGEGGDIIVIDDPHKIEEATSATAREGAVEWFSSTISTRLNDPQQGAIVIVGQRLHERDLFGHLLDHGGWQHLCLPAEYEPEHPYLYAGDPRSDPGELLWAARFGPSEIEGLKRELGSLAAAGQLQQRPAPAGGGIFKRQWWSWYPPAGPLPEFDRIIQSWDLAFEGSQTSDYVVGQAWGLIGPDKYLLHQVRERLSFTQTLEQIRGLTNRLDSEFPQHRGHAILVEHAANGAAVIDVLRRQISSVVAIRPSGSKISRASAVSPQVEAGNVYLPGAPNHDRTGYDRALTPDWVQGLLVEAESFPNGMHDDQVDAMAQALTRLATRAFGLRVLTATSERRYRY